MLSRFDPERIGIHPLPVDISHFRHKACEICRNPNANKVHTVPDKVRGTSVRFFVLECAGCGALNLLNVPDNLGDYYSREYYSNRPYGKFKSWLSRRWAHHEFGHTNLPGWALAKLYAPYYQVHALGLTKVSQQSRIIDVGCGMGQLLVDLAELGFTNLTGIDPFAAEEIREGKFRIFKSSAENFSGQYDLVMLHHSIEHAQNPRAVMAGVARLLAADGQVLIRLPVADSYAWREYNVNWSQLIPPLHIWLHTHKSIEILAREVGLGVVRSIHEDDERSLITSELERRGVPFHQQSVHHRYETLLGPAFKRAARSTAIQKAREHSSDCVAFILERLQSTKPENG